MRLLCLIIAAFLLSALVGADLPRRWIAGPVLLGPGPFDAFDAVAVKDPSIVRYKGQWHLFYTARNRSDYTLGYVSARTLQELAAAPRHLLRQLHSAESKYAAAPQVFYFRPQRRWYLIFQTTDSNYQPVYSTSTAIEDPRSWTPPKPLVIKHEKDKWIDFWVICDQKLAYLFFTRSHTEVVVMTTPLQDFPAGFSKPRAVFSPVHEAIHVYSAESGYAMLYEQNDGTERRFGLARAPSLTGPWSVAGENFATGKQLAYAPGQTRWTDEVSHGELLRAGFDERLEVSTDPWQFLVQGLPRESHRGEYPLLPWKLGLITAR